MICCKVAEIFRFRFKDRLCLLLLGFMLLMNLSACFGSNQGTIASLNKLAEGEELRVAQWSVVPNSFLIVKKIEGKLWLLQTTPSNLYYVVRGKNHLNDSNVRMAAGVDKLAVQKMIANEITGIGGLKPAAEGDYPAEFPVGWWNGQGYAQNAKGEWVIDGRDIDEHEYDEIGMEPESVEETESDEPGQTVEKKKPVKTAENTTSSSVKSGSGRIQVPVGVISWDSWYPDYWNKRPEGIPDNTWNDMKLINIASMNRYVLTYIKEKYNRHLVPFWAKQNQPPEKIKIYSNVKYSPELGRNTYDEHERTVTVSFDKDQDACDREIEYMANAGIDYVLFNYYKDNSPMSLGRKLFVGSNNKRGVKMSFIIGSAKETREIKYITDLMMQDYWFKIDGKPVVFFWPWDTTEQLQKYRDAYAARSGGGQLYVSILREGCYFSDEDVAKMVNENIDAVSAYSQTTDGNTHAESIMRAEVNGRNEVRTRMPNKDIIPNMTMGVENFFHRTDIDSKGDEYRKEAASLTEIDEKFESLAGFIDANSDRVKAVLIYSWNEITESGLPVCPTLNADGSINSDVLDRMAPWIK